MTTEKLNQLQALEKELLSQLREVRKQIAELQQPEPQIRVADQSRDTLEKLTKNELIQILNDMSYYKLTEAEKRKTKKWFIEAIVRRQRAEARGKAFKEMTN